MTRHDETASRRNLLRAIGSAAATGAIAGCSAFGDSTAGDPEPDDSTDDSSSDPADESNSAADSDRDPPAYGACSLTDDDIECSSPVEFGRTVTSDTVLGDECDHYRITADLRVSNGATLTVRPGTTLSFESATSLQVLDGSTLTAEGTCEEPIRFTGEQRTRGYWNGLLFRGTDDLNNRLEHVTIEYAGGGSFNHTVRKAGVVVMNARTSMERCTMRENAGEGIYLRYDATLDAFDHCLVTENETAAATRSPATHYLSGTSSYEGNDDDRIRVAPTSTGLEETAAVEWTVTDVRYVVTDILRNFGHLTVTPGATVSFAQDAGIDSWNGGRLTAVGLNPDDETIDTITFTGEQETRGYWRGLQFRDTDRTENRLRHAVVEYGGSQTYNHTTVPANVTVRAGARLSVDDTEIRESGGYGVAFAHDETIDSFAGNAVTRNASGAAWVRSTTAHFFSDTSSYTGNDDDRIVVVPTSSGLPEDMDVEWEAVDARYVVENVLYVQGDLLIEPGATVSFEQDAGMEVRSTGSLSAVGANPDESVDAITFTGEQRTAGYWRGLSFRASDRVENELHHVVVEYGGSAAYNHRTEPANVTAFVGSRLSIDDATLRHSGGYGLFVHDSNVTTANVTYENNDRGPEGFA